MPPPRPAAGAAAGAGAADADAAADAAGAADAADAGAAAADADGAGAAAGAANADAGAADAGAADADAADAGAGRCVPRVAPGGRRDVGWVGWAVSWVSGLVAGTGPPNLFLTLGRHRKLFRGWLRFAGRLMPGGVLPRRETELVILRVAHLTDCRYEFDHHVRLGRRAGVTAPDVDRLVAGPAAGGWSPRESALLATVDALHTHRNLTDPEWSTLDAHLNDREKLELLLLVGHYEMLATTITTLRIPPDIPKSQDEPQPRVPLTSAARPSSSDGRATHS